MRNTIATLSVAAVVVWAGPVPSAGAFEARVPEGFYGVSAPNLATMWQNGDEADVVRALDGIEGAELDWIRIEIGWREIEPTAPVGGSHAYDWSRTDDFVATVAEHELTIAPMLMVAPTWAANPVALAAGCGRRSGVALTRVGDYASFAAQVVRRYGRDGTFWAANPSLPYRPITQVELWNEPNWTYFWCPLPDPITYAALAGAAADAIHAVDPDEVVAFGGLAAIKPGDEPVLLGLGVDVNSFLGDALSQLAGLPGKIDAVPIHLYHPDPDVDVGLLGWFRSRLDDAGFDEAKMLVNEFGWHTSGGVDPVSEEARASLLGQLTGEFARTDCRIAAVAVHTWVSAEQTPGSAEDWYGISDPETGALYPTGEAYRDQVALYQGRGPTPAPRQTIGVCGGDPPDSDGDGVPDEDDDYPFDPSRSDGSGEVVPPAPEAPPDPAPRVSPARVPDSFFGVSIAELPTQIEPLRTHLDGIAAAGLGSARSLVDWSHAQPASPSTRPTSWAEADALTLQLARRGVGLAPYVGQPPAWALADAGGWLEPYLAFIDAYARRYGRDGTFWEENRNLDPALAPRWYEIDPPANSAQHWWDSSWSTAAYADLYEQARAALRGVDPGARAVLSLFDEGDRGSAWQTIGELVSARPSLAGAIDGVYVYTDSPTPARLDQVMRETRFALDETGNSGAPIYLGFGWSTAGAGAVTASEREQLYAEVADRLPRSDCGVEGVFAYAWTTNESAPSNPWAYYGIADPGDATLRPDGLAYADAIARYAGRSSESAARTALHPCSAPAPDRDGDGVADAADDAPLDPEQAEATESPPGPPGITTATAAYSAVDSITFGYSGAGATSFQCRLDSANWDQCPASGSGSYWGLPDGPHQISVRSVSALGLVGPASRFDWEVDTRRPETEIVSGPDGLQLTDEARFVLGADEPVATFWCRFDGGSWAPCTSPFIRTGLADGSHDFSVVAVDRAGNADLTAESASFQVATQPGAAAITAGPAAGSTVGPRPRFEFRAEFAAAMECRYDGGSWRPCSEPDADVPTTDLAPGGHTFEVRGIGGTGKRGASASRTFAVAGPDPGPPDPGASAPPAPAPEPAIEISKAPKRKTRDRTPTVRFTIAGAAAARCKVDSRREHDCASPFTSRRLRVGRHRIRITAVDESGAKLVARRVRFRIRR